MADNIEAVIARTLAPILHKYEKEIADLRAQLVELASPVYVEGLEVEAASDDPRSIALVSRMSDGTRTRHLLQVPLPIYRDIWQPGEYEEGDMVTHKGAAWIVRCESTTAEPGTCEDWRCFVQRGKPGPRGRDAN